MEIRTERCLIKESNNKDLKKNIDERAETFFELPSIKLKPGQKKEDFLSAIGKLVESLQAAETSTDELVFEIIIDDETAGYIRLVSVSTSSPEIQVAFLPEYQGSGYAYESLSALIPTLFENYNYKTIIWRANPRNIASCKLAKKLSATLDATATEGVGGIIEIYILRKV